MLTEHLLEEAKHSLGPVGILIILIKYILSLKCIFLSYALRDWSQDVKSRFATNLDLKTKMHQFKMSNITEYQWKQTLGPYFTTVLFNEAKNKQEQVPALRSEVMESMWGRRAGRCGRRGEPRWAGPRRWWPPDGWAEESPAPPAPHSCTLALTTKTPTFKK